MVTTSAVPTSSWQVVRRAAVAALAAAGSLVFVILLLSLAHIDAIPVFVVAALGGVAGLAAWRPGAALMVLAAAVPVAAWTGRTWHGSVAWPESLVVAFAAGYLARPVWTRRRAPDGLDLPIAVFASIVLASLAVRLLVLQWTIGGEALWLQMRQVALGGYFIGSGGFPELDAAMRLVEGLVLLRAAASTSAAAPLFGPLLVRWFVVGAAVAAALNLWRIWQSALRTDTPLAQFFEYLSTLRYNVHYGDVNAAGSYFVMALLVAIALFVAGRRAGWTSAVVLIAASLLLSGSRTAVVGGGIAALVWAGQSVARHRGAGKPHSALAAALLLVIAGGLAAALIMISGRSASPSAALQIRAELARTTFRMVGTHPVFGVGVGQYYERSGTYGTPVLVQTFRVQNENAHNNFLQVLGELGLIGFATFIWVLGAAALACLAYIRRTEDFLSAALGAGLLAFVLTWLAGHPLLVDEPALLFWLLLGTVAGRGAVGAPARGSWRPAGIAGALAVLVAIASIPLRAQDEFADADLEHRGIGLSRWEQGDDGVVYRVAGTLSTVFLPADARAVTIPLRSIEPDTVLHVALRLNGRPANVVQVPADAWYPVQLAVPPDSDAPRFYRLELQVQNASSENTAMPLLMIGKVQPHGR